MNHKSFDELSRVGKYYYLKDLEKNKIDEDEVEVGPSHIRPAKISRLDDRSR